MEATRVILRTLWSPIPPLEVNHWAVPTSIEECVNKVHVTRGSELDPDPIALIFIFLELCATTSGVDRRRESHAINELLDELASVTEGQQLEDLGRVHRVALRITYDTLRTLGLENSRLGRRVEQIVYPERRY